MTSDNEAQVIIAMHPEVHPAMVHAAVDVLNVSPKHLDLPDGPPMDDWIDYLYAGPR